MGDAILFMCVANSARSQMAEGWARHFAPAGEFFSAGSYPSIVHPTAIQVMQEAGIDIRRHVSKGMSAIPLDRIGTVITLCADEVCPTLPVNVTKLRWPLPDPAARGESALDGFRRTRDDLKERIRDYLVSRGLLKGNDIPTDTRQPK